MNFKRLSLTDIKIDIPRVPKKKSLVAAMEAAGNTNSSCTNPQVCAKVVLITIRNYFSFVLWLFLSCVFTNKKQWDGRCEEQVGEQFMGQKADCAEKKSFSQ